MELVDTQPLPKFATRAYTVTLSPPEGEGKAGCEGLLASGAEGARLEAAAAEAAEKAARKGELCVAQRHEIHFMKLT